MCVYTLFSQLSTLLRFISFSPANVFQDLVHYLTFSLLYYEKFTPLRTNHRSFAQHLSSRMSPVRPSLYPLSYRSSTRARATCDGGWIVEPGLRRSSRRSPVVSVELKSRLYSVKISRPFIERRGWTGGVGGVSGFLCGPRTSSWRPTRG